MIHAKIITDSVCGENRLTTWECTFPRFILPEILTHRSFSRNTASSRAIPLTKMIASVQERAAQPVQWGANQSGMQAERLVTPYERTRAKAAWFNAASAACDFALKLRDENVHKQIANRLIEPFAHTTMLISATEVDNFFALRAEASAQPEFQVLAYAMLRAYLASTPRVLKPGQWHMPLITDDDHNEPVEDHMLVLCSAARCARVSYTNHGKECGYAEDARLADRLLASGHMSPMEHVAQATGDGKRYRNFTGFKQFRQIHEEAHPRPPVDLTALMAAAPSWVTDILDKP